MELEKTKKFLVTEGWNGDKTYEPKDFMAVSYFDPERGKIGADFYHDGDMIAEVDPWREGNGVDDPELVEEMYKLVIHRIVTKEPEFYGDYWGAKTFFEMIKGHSVNAEIFDADQDYTFADVSGVARVLEGAEMELHIDNTTDDATIAIPQRKVKMAYVDHGPNTADFAVELHNGLLVHIRLLTQ